MKWLRRIAAAPLLLAGADLHDRGHSHLHPRPAGRGTVGSGVFTAIIAAAFGIGAVLPLASDILVLRQPRSRRFATGPIRTRSTGRLLYVVALILMLAAPAYQLAPVSCGLCRIRSPPRGPWRGGGAGGCTLRWPRWVFACSSSDWPPPPRRSRRARFGEGGMLFLLPMEGFPVLLIVYPASSDGSAARASSSARGAVTSPAMREVSSG